eukprot:3457637-Amphidinium_carterae.1
MSTADGHCDSDSHPPTELADDVQNPVPLSTPRVLGRQHQSHSTCNGEQSGEPERVSHVHSAHEQHGLVTKGDIVALQRDLVSAMKDAIAPQLLSLNTLVSDLQSRIVMLERQHEVNQQQPQQQQHRQQMHAQQPPMNMCTPPPPQTMPGLPSGLVSCIKGSASAPPKRASTFYPDRLKSDARSTSPAPCTPPVGQTHKGVSFHEGTPNRQPRRIRTTSAAKSDGESDRRARAVIGKFPSQLTRDEARRYVDGVIPLPDGCFVLTRGKYNERCTLVFSSPGECAEYIRKWIEVKPKLEGVTVYIGREQTQQDQLRGFVLRRLRDFLKNAGCREGLEPNYSQYCLYVRRRAIAYIDRDGEVVFTAAWPANIRADEASEWLTAQLGATQGVGASFSAVLATVLDLQSKMHTRSDDTRLPARIPSIFHWNASALYHVNDSLRRSRLGFLLKHAEEIITVCETHSCAADFPIDLGITHHIYQSHAHSSHVGGILIAVKRTLADADSISISFHEVVAGRVAAVIIQHKFLVLAGHFYAIRGYTWNEVASSASSFLDRHMHQIQVVAADINVDLCLADRIEVNTGRLRGSITPRTTFFRNHFPDAEWVEFCAGFTYNHLASSSLSAIDKIFIRCHLAELDSMNLVPRIVGAQTPYSWRSLAYNFEGAEEISQ